MGRPLNKKYFGNRNVAADGTYASGDNLTAGAEIGGEGIASYSTPSPLGAVVIGDTPSTNRNFPALTIPAPTMANGVQATATVVWEIAAVTLSSGGTGYPNSLTNQAIDNLIGSIYTSAITNPTITISTNGSGVVTAVTLGANRGTWTTIDGTGISTWGVKLGAVGTAQVTVTFRVKTITALVKGSGYRSAPTLSWGTNSGSLPGVPTATLTADTGSVGSVTNRENAILAWAYTASALRNVDIQSQLSTKRYRFNKTGETSREGVEIGRIRYDAIADGTAGYTAAEGVELNIVAQDSDGGTYLVRKLWNRTCTLNPLGINNSTIGITNNTAGTQFAAGTKVKWTFDTLTGADANVRVQILNA
jgi:hypothetical protein